MREKFGKRLTRFTILGMMGVIPVTSLAFGPITIGALAGSKKGRDTVKQTFGGAVSVLDRVGSEIRETMSNPKSAVATLLTKGAYLQTEVAKQELRQALRNPEVQKAVQFYETVATLGISEYVRSCQQAEVDEAKRPQYQQAEKEYLKKLAQALREAKQLEMNEMKRDLIALETYMGVLTKGLNEIRKLRTVMEHEGQRDSSVRSQSRFIHTEMKRKLREFDRINQILDGLQDMTVNAFRAERTGMNQADLIRLRGLLQRLSLGNKAVFEGYASGAELSGLDLQTLENLRSRLLSVETLLEVLYREYFARHSKAVDEVQVLEGLIEEAIKQEVQS